MLSSLGLGCGGAPPPAGASAVPSGATREPSTPPTPGSEPVAEDGKTAFRFTLPKPGDQRVDRESFTLALDIVLTDKGKTVATEKNGEGKRMLRHTTVLASDGKAVTKKKVRYEEMIKVAKKGEREQRTPSPLTGKTYVINLQQGKVVITGAGGEPVSDVEIEAVLDDNKEFGKPPQFAAFVPKHPLAPGETFSPPAEVLADMFGSGGGEGKRYSDVLFTFKGTEERAGKRLGKFELAMTVTEASKGATTTMHTRGTVLLMIDTGWPVELSLQGKVELSAPGDKPSQKVTGSGELEMKLAAEYR